MSLLSRIAVEPQPASHNTFVPHQTWVPPGARAMYGGQLISQALLAALGTVPRGFGLHSCHAYFLHPAVVEHRIEYRAEAVGEAKRYMKREVKGWQNGRVFFILIAGYAEAEIGSKYEAEMAQAAGAVNEGRSDGQNDLSTKVSHSLTSMAQPWDEDRSGNNGEQSQVKARFQVPYPKDLLPWSACENNNAFLRRLLKEESKESLGWKWSWFNEWSKSADQAAAPFTTAVARKQPGVPSSPEYYVDGFPTTRMVWYRPLIEPHEKVDEETYKAMIVYVTDFQFLGTSIRSLGLNASSTPQLGMIASLDHSIHYCPFPADIDYHKPVLHVMESQAADLRTGRAIVRGRVYSAEGWLLAVTCQEGVFKARREGEARRMTTESGIDEEDLRAKL